MKGQFRERRALTQRLRAQPLGSLGTFGKMILPWEVTVPTASAVLLSPGDRRAPGEG